MCKWSQIKPKRVDESWLGGGKIQGQGVFCVPVFLIFISGSSNAQYPCFFLKYVKVVTEMGIHILGEMKKENNVRAAWLEWLLRYGGAHSLSGIRGSGLKPRNLGQVA